MTRIKLCGLTRPADIAAVNQLHPDYIGFVFAPQSRRHVTEEAARALRRALQPGILTVGVFVDEPVENVAHLLESGLLDIAQLHGQESVAYLQSLRARTKKPLIQAFRIRRREDLTAAMDSAADHILLDAGAGQGRTFDWQLLHDFSRPYFLAGGLTPDNAAEAVQRLRPYALDVSSGVETDGVKDEKKMTAFVAAVRKEDHR